MVVLGRGGQAAGLRQRRRRARLVGDCALREGGSEGAFETGWYSPQARHSATILQAGPRSNSLAASHPPTRVEQAVDVELRAPLAGRLGRRHLAPLLGTHVAQVLWGGRRAGDGERQVGERNSWAWQAQGHKGRCAQQPASSLTSRPSASGPSPRPRPWRSSAATTLPSAAPCLVQPLICSSRGACSREQAVVVSRKAGRRMGGDQGS